jgi:hypothetical protein
MTRGFWGQADDEQADDSDKQASKQANQRTNEQANYHLRLGVGITKKKLKALSRCDLASQGMSRTAGLHKPKGKDYEGASFGQENVRQMQDYPASWQGPRHLREPAP